MLQFLSSNILRPIILIAVLFLSGLTLANAQQLPDREFNFEVTSPAFQKNQGPNVVVDKAHSPYVARGSFDPFLNLAGNDGFKTGYLEKQITKEALATTDILVIVNAYKRSFREFPVLQPPSAYTQDEINELVAWVKAGGRLLLIADHAPFAGGTVQLAESLGFTFINGYVVEKKSIPFLNGKVDYRMSKGINPKNPILGKQSDDMKIERFFTFTGSAFIPPAEAKSLLTIPQGYTSLLTNSIRVDVQQVQQIDVSGLSAGATLELGEGRIAVFAEAGSFSAQIINNVKTMGINNPHGAKNPHLILATLRWLAEGI